MLPNIEEDQMYVYFWLLECEYDNIAYDPIIKIGITKDWVKRRPGLISQLEKCKWPDWLESGAVTNDTLIGVIEGGRNKEKYLHNLFGAHSLGNELFWYKEIEEEIDDILDEHCNCLLHSVWDNYVHQYG